MRDGASMYLTQKNYAGIRQGKIYPHVSFDKHQNVRLFLTVYLVW